MASTSVYSFDVFDTCVSRTYAHPRDLFYELGLRIAPPNLERREQLRFAARFQSLRIRAEKAAHYHVRPRKTVTIEEIYTHFSMPGGLPFDASDLIRAELDLERESIYPIPAAVSHLENLRKAGHRIIFISDMYLPSSLLAPILKECGVMKEEDTLYVSCDAGVTKHHGQLFHHVLNAERLGATQLVHAGDNLRADVAMATKASIQVNHWRDGMLTLPEAAMAGQRLPRERAKSFLAALTRRLRLSDPKGSEGGPLDHVIHGIVVPLLLAYVSWILEHARQHGIRRLYFVARDAEVMLRVAQVLQGESDAIELRYLYGSRRAWLGPSINRDDTDWQRLLVIPGQTSSRHDITVRMGLNEAARETLREMLSCSNAAWVASLPRDQAHRFLSEIVGSAPAMELILSSTALEREAALAYFRQEGLFDATPWALVDAGWSLNAQAALKRILDAAGDAHQAPTGYYLALARDHLDESQIGIAYPFIPKAGSIFSRRRVIIEHCFLPSTHATTRGYRVEGTRAHPVFGPELRSTAELGYAARLQEAALSATRLASADPRIMAGLTEHISEILANAERLLRHPCATEARAMSTFGTVADMRHEAPFVEPLCRPLHLSDIWTVFSMALSRKKNFESPSFMWLEGSVALSPWHIRAPLKLALLADSLRNRLRS
jgi:FMN phosphatase YigB (HAD superfamily)